MQASPPAAPVPMFPLSGVFLFPSQLLPLHIFEPRYRQMIEDSLDGPGRIVLGTIQREEIETPDHVPAVLGVAGLGEIVRHEKLEEGRFHVWLLGLMRVRIVEAPTERLYRMVQCLPFAEVTPPRSDTERLRHLLREATAQRVPSSVQLPEATPTGMLADLLVQTLQAPQDVVEAIFAEASVAERARKALAAHERFPPAAGRE